MSTRRRHAKSRRGCTECKRGHVRCDESGPPCARCELRGLSCEYSASSSLGKPTIAQQDDPASHARPQAEQPESRELERRDNGSDKLRTRCISCAQRHIRCDKTGPPCSNCKLAERQCDYTLLTPTSTSTSTFDTSSAQSTSTAITNSQKQEQSTLSVIFPPSPDLLELQLIHRWTALTYKSCCTPGSGDDEVWQIKVPQLAIRHEYLRYGIFSLAALETAQSKPGPSPADKTNFVRAGVEYQGRSIGAFRALLSAIPTIPSSRDDFEAKLCMHLMLMVLIFASSQAMSPETCSESMVETVLSNVELLRGSTPILEENKDYLATNPYIQRIKPLSALTRTPLVEALDEAFVQLAELNDRRVTASARDSSDERRIQQIGIWEACKKALVQLRELFEKCGDDYSRGYALGWLNMAGDEYVRAVVQGDSVALLMLMYWGVLAERCGQQVWWAEGFGVKLVEELAGLPVLQETDDGRQNLAKLAVEYVSAAFRAT